MSATEELALCGADRFMLPVYTRMLFFYENTLNFEALERALITVLQRDYKPWLGVVAQVDENKAVLRYNPNAVPSLTKRTIDSSYADVKGSDGSYRFISDDLVVPKELFVTAPEAQILHTVLFTFAKSDGCVLAVSLHHRAGDGSAQFTFVKAWSDEVKGLKHTGEAIIHERSCLPKIIDQPIETPPSYRHIVNRPPLPASYSPATSILVRFPTQALHALKSQLSATIPSPQYVSTNDVLLALMFRAVTRAKNLPVESPTFTKFNADGRFRNAGIPLTYAGNVVLFTMIEPKNVGEVLNSSLAEVALWYRSAINSITKTSVANMLSFLDQFSMQYLQESFFYMTPYLHISNWDTLGDLTEYDFGTGPAAAIRLPPPGIDSIFYILPSVGAVECVVGLTPEVLARFREDKELLQAGAEMLGEFSALNPDSNKYE